MPPRSASARSRPTRSASTRCCRGFVRWDSTPPTSGAHTWEPTGRPTSIVAIARGALERHGLRVATYATWVTPANVERACELARGIGTDVIGAGFSGEPEALAPVLREHGRPSCGREPSRENPERGALEARERWRRVRRDRRHGLVGNAGLRRRPRDLGARRARRARPPEGCARGGGAARHVCLGRGRRRCRGMRAGAAARRATTVRSRSSTSPRTTTRATRSSSSARRLEAWLA